MATVEIAGPQFCRVARTTGCVLPTEFALGALAVKLYLVDPLRVFRGSRVTLLHSVGGARWTGISAIRTPEWAGKQYAGKGC